MRCELAVVSVRLSGAGLPLAVLSNNTAYALHLGMKTWMRVADSNFSFSSYMSLYSVSASSAGMRLHLPLHRLLCYPGNSELEACRSGGSCSQ